jgi:hypothetical protein
MGTSNGVSETIGDAFCKGRAIDGQSLRHVGGASHLLCGEYSSWQLGCGRIQSSVSALQEGLHVVILHIETLEDIEDNSAVMDGLTKITQGRQPSLHFIDMSPWTNIETQCQVAERESHDCPRTTT